MTPSQAFFTVHRDLLREGPGLSDDVHWALEKAATPEDAFVLDAACGPGADTVTLAEALPRARVEAVDFTAHFVEDAKARTLKFGNRVRVREGDYTDLIGEYDLIWCAGAAYFKGFLTVLDVWRDHLKIGGAIAFSEPALVTAPASPDVETFWAGEGDIHALEDLELMLARKGWQIEAQRWIIGEAWQAYYDGMAERVATLKTRTPHPMLAQAIAKAEQEIANWKAAPDDIAYSLFVVRPG